MPKTRILLASILKPVTDTRMFSKLGCSLAKLPETEIHLVGQASPIMEQPLNMVFHPVFYFKRSSLDRLTAQWKYYKILHKVKPDIIVNTTPELLPVSILFKVLFKAELFYDVQENYLNNITKQNIYPAWLRPSLGKAIRCLEKLSGRFIAHYFLAEKSYATELTFLGENYTVLENKYAEPTSHTNPKAFPVRLDVSKGINLLYSGTISEVYGIWEAIKLVEKLNSLNPEIRLTIIGHCPQESTFQALRNAIKDKTYISLIGGNVLVPHSEVRKAIRSADLGLLSYQPNPSTADCIPTKLYEYLANGLPMLIPENPTWEEIINKTYAGFSIDYFNSDPVEILNQLSHRSFYAWGIPQNVFWSSEEEKLLMAIKKNHLIT